MDQLEGLEELSLVRGYFQLIGDSDPLRHQLTSSVQGIFFHKYGRVTMVTSDDHLYLKGNKIPPVLSSARNISTRQNDTEMYMVLVTARFQGYYTPGKVSRKERRGL